MDEKILELVAELIKAGGAEAVKIIVLLQIFSFVKLVVQIIGIPYAIYRVLCGIVHMIAFFVNLDDKDFANAKRIKENM
jgi:hypothetical protein